MAGRCYTKQIHQKEVTIPDGDPVCGGTGSI